MSKWERGTRKAERPRSSQIAFRLPRSDLRLRHAAEERPAIFQIHLRRYCRQEVAELPTECLTASEGWTGAEIKQAVRKAGDLLFTRQLDVVAAIRRAMELVRPTTANVPQMIEEALDNVDDLELLPESYRKLALARRKRPMLVEESTAPVQRGTRRL
jgi:hypothetical protein